MGTDPTESWFKPNADPKHCTNGFRFKIRALKLPSKAFSSGVSDALIPADILKVRFLLGGGQQISLSKLAKKLKKDTTFWTFHEKI